MIARVLDPTTRTPRSKSCWSRWTRPTPLDGWSARSRRSCWRPVFGTTSYLDRYYSLHPAGLLGAKRLVVLLPVAQRGRLGQAWIDDVGQYATLVRRGGRPAMEDLADHEYS